MKTLEYPAGKSPTEWGQLHGETFRSQIHEIAAIRTELTVKIGEFDSEAQVLEIADAHLPVLEQFDADLHAELVGIAEGADLTPGQIVVVNHYTDLRDIHPGSPNAGDDDCSAVLLRGSGTAMLAQTWDMHGSAAPYVMMLHTPPVGGDPDTEAWTLSITGCLGMTGMNRSGLGITINNLRSKDARVGVVWPALVRRALREKTAEDARDLIVGAKLGSGHHYLVATDRKAFGIETSGTRSKVVFDAHAGWYVHTNHCIDDELASCSTVHPESTTRDRYSTLSQALMNLTTPTTVPAAWTLLSKVNQNLATAENPHAMATCGAIVMDLKRKRVWGRDGLIDTSRRPAPLLFEGQEPVAA